MACATHRLAAGFLALAVASTVAPPAGAYDFEVSLRTEGYGYQLRRYDRGGLTFLNRRRLTQYLGLRVFDLLDPDPRGGVGGGRPPQLLYLSAVMRFFTDFGGYARPLNDWRELRDAGFELLYGAVEGRGILGFLDFSLGRQFDAELMDFFGFDGLRLRVNSPWKLFAETHFGIEVDRARPFSPAVFETDGVSGDAADESIAPTFGVAFGIEDLHHLDLRVAYRQVASRAAVPVSEPGAAARDISTTELWGVDQELVFVSAAYRLPSVGTVLLLGVRHNLLLGNFDEVQGALTQRVGDRHRFEIEALRSRPHFDGDSIFNVFGVEPFNEVAGRYALRPLPGLTVELRGGYRWFWSDDREALLEPGALSAGLIGGWRASHLFANLELYYLCGLSSWRGGGDIDARWRIRRFLSLDGRLSLVASNDEGARDEVGGTITTFGLQLGSTVHFTRGVKLHLVFEDNISRLYASAIRLYAMLDLEFAIR